MNVAEEFKKLKDFVEAFKEEIKSQQKEFDKLEKELDRQRQELSDKKQVIELLESKLNRFEKEIYEQNFQVTPYTSQKNFVTPQPARQALNQPQKLTLPLSMTKRISTRNSFNQQSTAQIKNQSPDKITGEFNAFANVQDRFSLKNLRDEFVQKYNVRAFSCVNFEARMNEPIPPPQFSESENVLSSEYWAINNKGNVFMVFPNVRQYTNNHHTARAMGEIFSSNFTAGRTYTKIFVQQPAFFECNGNVWKFKFQGKLRLE